jgi:hypothetical protein
MEKNIKLTARLKKIKTELKLENKKLSNTKTKVAKLSSEYLLVIEQISKLKNI